MKKKFRLLKNKDFQKIIKIKKQFLTKTLVLYYQKNNEHLKIGLSISKKFGNAVIRNYTRRKIRHILLKIDVIPLKYNVVLIARKSFINMPFAKQEIAVKNIFEKLIEMKGYK